MEPKSGANYLRHTRVTTPQRRNSYPRVIPYGSYAENTAARALIIIGVAVLTGFTLWALVASSVLSKLENGRFWIERSQSRCFDIR